MAKLDDEEINRRIIEKHNGNIKILEYNNLKTPGRFECLICGFSWYTTASCVLVVGSGCPNCYNNRRSDTTRKTHDEVYKELSELGCRWVGGEYKNIHSVLKLVLSCGHEISKCLNDIKYGSYACHQCRKEEKINRILNILKENDLTFISISGEIKLHDNVYIKYSCLKGHITEKTLDCFYISNLCRECSFEKQSERNKYTHEEIIKLVEDCECELISDKNYKNRESNVTVRFNCGHEETLALFVLLLRGSKLCKSCSDLAQKGTGHNAYKDGNTDILSHLRDYIKDWIQESLRSYNYKCFISGLPAQIVHHLYPFHKIAKKTLSDLNFKEKKKMSDFNIDELVLLEKEFIKNHNDHGLGIPLTKKIHHLFHSTFPGKNFTPENFYEFQSRIESGEIQI